jgi:hypothetical protein
MVVFRRCLLGEPGELERYWHHMVLNQPRELQHPRLQNGLVDQAVPCLLHGDDAGVMEKEKILILQLTSYLTSRGEHKLSALILALIPYTLVVDHLTLDQVYTWIMWSLNAATLGIHPSLDPFLEPLTDPDMIACAGKVIADGYCFTLEGQLGDWKWTKETFGLKAYGHNNCCHLDAALLLRHIDQAG